MSDHHDAPDPVDLRLAAEASHGCEESRLLLSRRALLGLGVGLFTAAFLPKTATAGTPSDPRMLLILLRGGMDGLDVLAPVGDPQYASRRQNLALAPDNLLNLDGTSFFALNKALPTFQELYNKGEAAFVPATCVPLHTRSHFDCQDNLENGMPGLAKSTTGWLNRALQVMSTSHPVRVGGALAVAEAPLVLRGPVPTLGWSLNWLQGVDGGTMARIRGMYGARDKTLLGMLDRGLKAHQIASDFAGESKADNAIPESEMSRLRKGFRGAARLLKDNDGPRIAVITVDNFDTHGMQGAVIKDFGGHRVGHLGLRLEELDTGLKDFRDLLGAEAWANTVVLAISEFGRKVEPNGSLGTDHGVGGLAMLAGGAVNGGPAGNGGKGGFYGAWPFLGTLYQGVDLKPEVDARSIFKGILNEHFGLGPTALHNSVFPSSGAAAPILAGMIKPKPPGQQAMIDVPAGHVTIRRDNGILRYRQENGGHAVA